MNNSTQDMKAMMALFENAPRGGDIPPALMTDIAFMWKIAQRAASRAAQGTLDTAEMIEFVEDAIDEEYGESFGKAIAIAALEQHGIEDPRDH